MTCRSSVVWLWLMTTVVCVLGCYPLQVMPVYVFDPHYFKISQYGCRKMGRLRASFLLESLRDLRRSLRALGSDLLVAAGPPEKKLPSIAAQLSARRIYAQAEVL
jgi:deoxyribodipyrimidine photo-lyase